MIQFIAAIVATLALAGCSFTENRHVQANERHLVCSADADCTYAALACSTCGDPVAKKYAAELQAKSVRICMRYRGPVVDCPPYIPPACKAGHCSVGSSALDPNY